MARGVAGTGPHGNPTLAKPAAVTVAKPAANPVPVARDLPERQAAGVTVRRAAPKPKREPPDMVLVRAIEKGFYGFERDMIVRNPGEVFEMATEKMRVWPLGNGEHPVEGATIIDVTDEAGNIKGQFELPGWVELADEATVTDDERERHGMMGTSIRTQIDKAGNRNMEIIV